MGIMVYSLLWVMQDFVHQPYAFGSDPIGRHRGLMYRSPQPQTPSPKPNSGSGCCPSEGCFSASRRIPTSGSSMTTMTDEFGVLGFRA